jgi:hypothetical protein
MSKIFRGGRDNVQNMQGFSKGQIMQKRGEENMTKLCLAKHALIVVCCCIVYCLYSLCICMVSCYVLSISPLYYLYCLYTLYSLYMGGYKCKKDYLYTLRYK